MPTSTTGLTKHDLVGQFPVLGEEVLADEFSKRRKQVVAVTRQAPVRTGCRRGEQLGVEDDDSGRGTAKCFDMNFACLRSVDTIY